MKRFKWKDVVTEELSMSITGIAGITSQDDVDNVRQLLVMLLEVAGGPPFTNDNFTDEIWDRIALGLLDDAFREVFADDIRAVETTGTVLEKIKHTSLEHEIEIGDIVHVNWCTEEQLESLPEIGTDLAHRIVQERRLNGAFRGGKNLADRVPGIGEGIATKILWRLRFNRPPTLIPSPNDLYELIKWLIAKMEVPPEEGLHRLLEYTIAHLKGAQHKRWYATRCYEHDLPSASHECSWIGILEGREYYSWICTALDEAEHKIDMAMFHVALPSEDHPTHILINKLIAAKNRGVKIRVLLDKDRASDPYKSSIINKNALDTLCNAGVDARFDTEEQLLHSKFLAIDEETAIIGSHNWSAGSYLHWDDMSFAISSKSFTCELHQRFEKLWRCPIQQHTLSTPSHN